MMKSYLFAIAAGLCWGVGELCTKSALASGRIGPITSIALRSTVALPLLWIAWLYATRSMSSEPRGWTSAGAPTLAKIILGSGVTAGAAAMIFFYLALSMGEISRVKPIAFTLAPLTAVILGWLILGEAMTVKKAIGVGLTIAGVVMLTRP